VRVTVRVLAVVIAGDGESDDSVSGAESDESEESEETFDVAAIKGASLPRTQPCARPLTQSRAIALTARFPSILPIRVSDTAAAEEKLVKGKKYYLVSWEGYDDSDDTWEPASSIPAENEVLAEYLKNKWASAS
jgi:hypothetical protein